MIRHSLRAAIAAAVFVVEASSQSGGRPSEPRDRMQRSQQDRRTPGQPSDATKRAESTASAVDRARAFLEQHPDPRARLFARDDADHDASGQARDGNRSRGDRR